MKEQHLSANGDATMVDADDTEEQELIRASAALAGQSEDAQEEVIEVDDGADVADEPETAEVRDTAFLRFPYAHYSVCFRIDKELSSYQFSVRFRSLQS